MVYSAALAERIRQSFPPGAKFLEKKMFGGVCFLVGGNLCVGVWHDSLIVRLGVDQADAVRNQPHVRPFDVTGKPMRGWLMIEPDGIDADRDLRRWIAQAFEFVRTLPVK